MTATYQHIRSTFFSKGFIDDDATAATARKIGWTEMGEHFLAHLTFRSGTGVLVFDIYCADNSDGTGNVTLVKAHAAPTAADAAGDELVLEVSAAEVHAASATGRYVSVHVQNDDNADENDIHYFVKRPGHRAYGDLTPQSTIS